MTFEMIKPNVTLHSDLVCIISGVMHVITDWKLKSILAERKEGRKESSHLLLEYHTVMHDLLFKLPTEMWLDTHAKVLLLIFSSEIF